MFDRSWCKSNFFPGKISNSYRKYRFEKIFLLYHSSQKFNALEFEGETRRSSGNSKISSKNCLSIFPFYNLRFIERSSASLERTRWKQKLENSWSASAKFRSRTASSHLLTRCCAHCVESRAGKVFFSSQPSKNSLPRSRVVEKFCLITYTRVLSFASLLSYIFPAQFCVSN